MSEGGSCVARGVVVVAARRRSTLILLKTGGEQVEFIHLSNYVMASPASFALRTHD